MSNDTVVTIEWEVINLSQQRAVRLDQITIAVGDEERMVGFYSQLFQTEFTAVDCGSFKLHIGEIGGIVVQFCPKAVAGIEATQNIHQLRFVVPEFDRWLAAAIAAGGEALGDVTNQGAQRLASVRDPDGNSIEFIEAGA